MGRQEGRDALSVIRMRWLAAVVVLSAVASLGSALVLDRWGNREGSGTTNWVDQVFGLPYWLGAVAVLVFGVLLLGSVVAAIWRAVRA